jgi:hypothetical protein
MERKESGKTDGAALPAGRVEVKTAGGFVNVAARMREARKLFFQHNGNRFYLMEAKKLEARGKREEQPGLVKEWA